MPFSAYLVKYLYEETVFGATVAGENETIFHAHYAFP
jgi:hypothetical protein